MEKFLKKLTIRQKMRFGFGVIWAVLAVITIQAVVNLYIVRENVIEVVEQRQPIALQANQMSMQLEKTMSTLGQYMLTGEKATLERVHTGIEQTGAMLEGLQTKSVNQESIDPALLGAIAENLAAFPEFVDQVEQLQTDRAKKFPAFAFVDDNLMPHAVVIQQQINLMIESEWSDLRPERKPVLDILLGLQKNWLNVLSGVRGYVAFRSDNMAATTEEYLNQVEQGLRQLSQIEGLRLTFEEEMGLETTQKAYEIYRENFMRLKLLHEGPKWRMDTWLMENKIQPLSHELESQLEKIASSAARAMQATSDQVVDSTLRNLIILLTLSVIGQWLGMVISKRVTQSVARPVKRSADAMKDIAYGEGDLTRRLHVEGKDELASLAYYFNEFISRMQSTLREVTDTVKELESASRSMLSVTHSTKTGTDEQLTASNQLSESMVSMSEKAKSVEDHSHNTSRSTEQAAERVKESGEVVKSAGQTIRQVATEMDKITEAVNQLNHDSQTISTVTNVIREIAEQTNLLALNAAIEAARAGEHGRGFAVVADQVRVLAQRTQESTTQIEEVIQKIQNATESTVTVVEGGRQTTKQGYESVMRVDEVLSPVVILIEDINHMSSQMLTAAQAQTTLAQEVNEHISKIHLVSQNTAGGASDTEASSNRLQRLASKLEELVQQFKIY